MAWLFDFRTGWRELAPVDPIEGDEYNVQIGDAFLDREYPFAHFMGQNAAGVLIFKREASPRFRVAQWREGCAVVQDDAHLLIEVYCDNEPSLIELLHKIAPAFAWLNLQSAGLPELIGRAIAALWPKAASGNRRYDAHVHQAAMGPEVPGERAS